MSGGAERCNACGKGGKLLSCSACKQVAYCSKEHQRQDWRAHKHACLLSRSQKGKAVDDGGGAEYTGTFRWTADTKFMVLPERSGKLLKPPPTALAQWDDYLDWRLRRDGNSEVVVEPSLLDALSFPVTLAWAFKLIKLAPVIEREGKASIIIAGAAHRCEERLLLQTSYWTEVEPIIPCADMRLCFVGPEVSKEFLRSGLLGKGDEPGIVPLIGFNCGFGSHHDKKLMHSWVEDLEGIVDSNIPCVFTCANDHTDVRGEMAMMTEVLGARVVLKPRENAFKAITTVHAPGARDTTWATANSYIYAIQGRAPGSAPAGANNLHQKVDAIAAALSK